MRLSAEQAQLAYARLRKKDLQPVELTTSRDVPNQLIERALGCIANTPDPRPDRVAEARDALRHQLPSSGEVAERMVWRMLADSLR